MGLYGFIGILYGCCMYLYMDLYMYLFGIYGCSIDFIWMFYRFYMDFIWILYGFYMDLYGFIGISRDLKGFYMDLFMAYFWESFGS
jgi:hypothetical protein